MEMFYLTCFVAIMTMCKVGGFLLNDPTLLSQYRQYGRSLVFVGGNLQDNNTEVYTTIVNMAGGRGRARIGIVNAASLHPEKDYRYYSNLFLHYGALETNQILIDINHTSGKSDPGVIKGILRQTGFFFGGGDPQRVVDMFVIGQRTASLALVAILERFKMGAVVAGTSAGAECLPSEVMIRGGDSWNALRYGSHSTMDQRNPGRLIYNLNGGLGLYDNFVVDAHFSQRGREGRLIRLLFDTYMMPRVGTSRGFGVDEDTALVVTHAGTAIERGKVIGRHGVLFADVSGAVSDHNTSHFSVNNISTHYLTHGDEINLNNMDVAFSSSKHPMKEHEVYEHALTALDIFRGKQENSDRKPEYYRIAASLFDARLDQTTFGDTRHFQPSFRVTMSKQYGEGWVERKGTLDDDIVSYINLYLGITERS